MVVVPVPYVPGNHLSDFECVQEGAKLICHEIHNITDWFVAAAVVIMLLILILWATVNIGKF